jgi:thymidylate kinase
VTLTASAIPLAEHGGPGRLIVVEGDAGAGKTSAIVRMARDSNLVVMRELDHVAFAEASGDPTQPSNGDWYIAAERARQQTIRTYLKSGCSVIQDRSIISTIAFAYAAAAARVTGYDQLLARVVDQVRNGAPFVRPDIVLSLSVDVDVGLRRRDASRHVAQYGIWFDRRFLLHFQRFMSHFLAAPAPFPVITVDTSSAPATATDEALRGCISVVNAAHL